MYIAVVPNRTSPPAILLRESFREHGKVKNRTLANLSAWSSDRVEALRQVLRGRALARPGAPSGRRAGDCAQLAAWACGGGPGERAPVGPRAAGGARALDAARAGGGDAGAPAPRPRLEAGHGPGLGGGDAHQHAQPRVAAAGGGRRRSLRRAGLAAGAARGDRTGAGPAPLAGRAAGALRRDLDVLRGAAVPVGQARPFAGRQAGQTADRVRRADECGGVSGGGRGVRRQHGGSEDAHRGPDEGAPALRPGAADSGRGPGDADGGPHSGGAGGRRGARVDHGAPGARDSGAGAQRRAAAVAV